MRRAVRLVALVAGLALETACGGGAIPTAATDVQRAPAAEGAPRAHITVTFGLDTVAGPSLDPAYAEYLRFSTLLAESAGVGASLNYVRGEFYRSNVLVERYEMGAAELVASGGNRLEPHGSRSLTVTLRRNGPCDLVRATFQFTDDRGNEHYIVGNVGAGTTPLPASPGGVDAPRL